MEIGWPCQILYFTIEMCSLSELCMTCKQHKSKHQMCVCMNASHKCII